MRRTTSAFLFLSAVALAAFFLAVRFGDQPVSVITAWTQPGSVDATILYSLRLPRAFLAALVGAALAVSGAVLQGLMRNPLADPFVLGVSGGAALGATLALAAGAGSLSLAWQLSAPAAAAFVGALAATGIVFFVGRVEGRSSPLSILLSGTIFNAFALAAITSIRALAAPERLGEILFWLSGSLGYERPGTLVAAFALQLFSIGGLWLLSGRLNVLSLGDEDAQTLGLPVEQTRFLILGLSSLSIAGAVALSGLIGFVGLIVPHLVRLWVGADQRVLVPCSAVGGAALLLLSDLSIRLLFGVFHRELPVGVLTAILGGPFFLFLLHRRPTANAIR